MIDLNIKNLKAVAGHFDQFTDHDVRMLKQALIRLLTPYGLKFYIYSGRITSATDSDTHYLSSHVVYKNYQIPRMLCRFVPDDRTERRHFLRGLAPDPLRLHLYGRDKGDYERHVTKAMLAAAMRLAQGSECAT